MDNSGSVHLLERSEDPVFPTQVYWKFRVSSIGVCKYLRRVRKTCLFSLQFDASSLLDPLSASVFCLLEDIEPAAIIPEQP